MAIDYYLYIDWYGTDDAWFDGAEAVWIPKGAPSAQEALTDLTGNGNDLNYDDYDESGWSAENGWAGVSGDFFDTGILPALEQTIYVAFTDTEDTGVNAEIIGVSETISGTARTHSIRNRGGTSGLNTFFENTQYQDGTHRPTAVVAMNKNGTWRNGTKVNTENVTDDYTFTQSMYLLALNVNGTADNFLTTGHVAAVCIVNATDDDDTIKLRSFALGNIINTNTAFMESQRFEDDLLSYSVKTGMDHYINASGTGFEPVSIGRATLVLDNTSGDYDPYNASSPLYGFISPGKLLRLGMTVLPVSYDIFNGVVDDITVNRQNKTVTLSCMDMWGWLAQKTPNAVIRQNTTVDQAITAVLNDVNYPLLMTKGVGYNMSAGIDTIPYWWPDGENAKREIERVTNAGLGFFYFDEGRPTYLTRRNKLSSYPEFTESVFLKNIQASEPWENRRNHVELRVTSRMAEDEAVLWEYSEQKVLAPGESITLWANYRYDGENIPAINVQAPAIVFNSRASGQGVDLSGDLTVEATNYARKTKLIIRNGGGSIGHIISATISGQPIVTGGRSTATDTDREFYVKPKPLYIDNPWIQDYNTAQGFAQFLLEFLTRRVPYVTARMQGRYSGTIHQFRYDLFQYCTLDLDTLGIDSEYRIISIEHTTGATVQDVTTTFKFMPAYETAGQQYFTLDVSELDGGDVLAW